MSSFHDAQTPEDDPTTTPLEKRTPIVYVVTREIGDRHVGPMEYNIEACAADFFLCASCGRKDRDAERMSDKSAAHAIETGHAELCEDCEEPF